MSGRRKTAKGVLLTVICLLAASGGLRAISGAGPALAIAQEQAEAVETPDTEVVSSDALADVLAAIREREDRVATRERVLSDRALALEVAEAEINEKLAELIAAEESLSATLSRAETASQSDISRLTAVYESMKPADAATLFEEMAPEFAAGFIAEMQPEAAAAIMAGVEPTTAYSISVIIAGRNADVPTQ